MKLQIKKLNFLTGKPVCMIHEKTAKKMSLHVGNRVQIKNNKGKKIISVVDAVSGIINPKQIAVSEIILDNLTLKNKDKVEVQIIKKPLSITLIKKKLNGQTLKENEIKEIIENIANNSLTEVEIAFFIAAVYTQGMNLRETKNLIQSMVKTGNKLKLKGKIYDKHCLGGVAGNRTTPIVVSICAAAGLKMPKTSSRAITSAAGTADTIETIAKVDFPISEIKKIIRKTNACFVWGGSLGLAPTDDKIIRIERIVNIDAPAQMLASILSKKISVGSKHILIDIPFGKSAKVSEKKAKELKSKFLILAKKFNLDIEVILTNGEEPIGNGIGPTLEIIDIIKVLSRNSPPKDLEEKSILLAGELLEIGKKAKKGKGQELAREILESKKAFEKFKEIIQAQQGDPNKLDIKNFKDPEFQNHIKTKIKTKIKHINNQLINRLARHAGCPEDKQAGIYIHKKKNQIAEKGDKILTIYAVSKEKLKHA
ncbi:thymidine phosphorylase, partial [Candidatus Woesearchaeota archaeon]|nr:thymidine phosphorylase [Candidatus Woesearchaeota archaeon]